MKQYIVILNNRLKGTFEINSALQNFVIPSSKVKTIFKVGKTYRFKDPKYSVFLYDEEELKEVISLHSVYQVQPIEVDSDNVFYVKVFKIIKKI